MWSSDSEVYAKLLDVETGLYSESPAYVFGLLQDELNFGHLVQAEIWGPGSQPGAVFNHQVQVPRVAERRSCR